jgi:3-deoxy-D-manno-octulosonic-acid transferase
MTPTFFDIIYLGLAPVVIPILAWRALRKKKYRESTAGMLGGRLGQEDPEMWRNGCVWVHSVSVGETMAAKAMMPLLKARFPELPLLVTTVTETGQALARSLVPGCADAARYYPADFSWVVKKFADTYKPRIFILMETEIWPNALMHLADRGTRIVMMNGRISAKSFKSYNLFKKALRQPLGGVQAFCMQTQADADRMKVLSGRPDRVFTTGNCKFDTPVERLDAGAKDALRMSLGIAKGERVVVAGSTHPGEEEVVLAAFKEVQHAMPQTKLLLVPRHPERFAKVWSLLEGEGIAARRLSDGQETGTGKAGVVLVDKMGLLVQLYGIADVALVAGSFVPGIGGHNVLEAAAHGTPVIYGPHMEKQPELARLLNEENGGTISDGEGLGRAILNLLNDSALAAEKGAQGLAVVQQNRGSAARNMEILERVL